MQNLERRSCKKSHLEHCHDLQSKQAVSSKVQRKKRTQEEREQKSRGKPSPAEPPRAEISVNVESAGVKGKCPAQDSPMLGSFLVEISIVPAVMSSRNSLPLTTKTQELYPNRNFPSTFLPFLTTPTARQPSEHKAQVLA